jgi:spermidine synthase
MATYNGDSEKMLVKAAIEASVISNCSVLIGGLGVGYSLDEAVRNTRVHQVTVIEIEEKIIAWNRSYLAAFSGNATDNIKTKIINTDLIDWISRTQDTFDVICLDIDNGPDWTVFQENNHLYDYDGLSILSGLLNPDGVISFWSASSSALFMKRLKTHFSQVQEIPLERKENTEPDFVYIAIKK